MSGARRIEAANQNYGKVLQKQGLLFMGSNCITAIMFYLLAS